jgi:UDP-N-acetylmuramate: L-alanyl-gamma-D-glutamyl-meso-diaminopimelate ligase
VILTSIEFDHADIYADLKAVKAAFQRLIEMIPEDGTLMYCGADANILDLLPHAKVKKQFSYGLLGCDFTARVLARTVEGTTFEVFRGGERLDKYQIEMSGDYNVLNATAVVAMAHQLGWAASPVREALATFKGVRRRQEIIGEPRGITIIEDFAHHPTAVRETVKAIQDRYSGRKVFAVFEPRSATSRRKIFQREYVEAFKGGAEVIVAEAFDQAKIDVSDRFSSQELVQELQSTGIMAHCLPGADAIVDHLGKQAQSGDVILIMSNGGFDGIYQKLLTRLSQTVER